MVNTAYIAFTYIFKKILYNNKSNLWPYYTRPWTFNPLLFSPKKNLLGVRGSAYFWLGTHLSASLAMSRRPSSTLETSRWGSHSTNPRPTVEQYKSPPASILENFGLYNLEGCQCQENTIDLMNYTDL